jgi:hypothetical protein
MSYTDIRSILLYEEVYFLPFGMCQNNILKQFVEVALKVEQGYFFHHLLCLL